jgi:hypothetical protein
LVSPVSGLTGLADLTVLNRAIGMLVDHGHDLVQARQVLHRDAAAARVAPHIYAARILADGSGSHAGIVQPLRKNPGVD